MLLLPSFTFYLNSDTLLDNWRSQRNEAARGCFSSAFDFGCNCFGGRSDVCNFVVFVYSYATYVTSCLYLTMHSWLSVATLCYNSYEHWSSGAPAND